VRDDLLAAVVLVLVLTSATAIAELDELERAVVQLSVGGAGSDFRGCGMGGDGKADLGDDWVCTGIEEAQLPMFNGYMDACVTLGSAAYCSAAKLLLEAGSTERDGCEGCGCGPENPMCTYLDTQTGLVRAAARFCRAFGGEQCNNTILYASTLIVKCEQYDECSRNATVGAVMSALGEACSATENKNVCSNLFKVVDDHITRTSGAGFPSIEHHSDLIQGLAQACDLGSVDACGVLKAAVAEDRTTDDPRELVSLLDAYKDACIILDKNDTAGEHCLRLFDLIALTKPVCGLDECAQGEVAGRLMRVLFPLCSEFGKGCEEAKYIARLKDTPCGIGPNGEAHRHDDIWNCGPDRIRDAGFLMQGYASGCRAKPEEQYCQALSLMADTGAGSESGRCGMGDGTADDGDDWDCGGAWEQASSAIAMAKACEELDPMVKNPSCEASKRLLRGYSTAYGCTDCGCGMRDDTSEGMDDWECDTAFAQGTMMVMYGQACRIFGTESEYCTALKYMAEQAAALFAPEESPETHAMLALGFAEACELLDGGRGDGAFCTHLSTVLKANDTLDCWRTQIGLWCRDEVAQGLLMLSYARGCDLLELPKVTGPFCTHLRDLGLGGIDEIVTSQLQHEVVSAIGLSDIFTSSEFVLTLAYARACELIEVPSEGPFCQEFLIRCAKGSVDRINPLFGCGPASAERTEGDWDCDQPSAQGEAMMAYAKALEICSREFTIPWELCEMPFRRYLLSLTESSSCGLGGASGKDAWNCENGGAQGIAMLGYLAAYDVIDDLLFTTPYPLFGPVPDASERENPLCDDDNNCTQDRWSGTACVTEFLQCGHVCGTGKVCDGEGRCDVLGQVNASCTCPDMCVSGLRCADGTCASTICGDGLCEDECTICPEDCTPDDCLGNSNCEPSMGEDCAVTAEDCLCQRGSICKPKRKHSIMSGCYVIKCGDNFCDSPDESSVTCCEDCKCPPDYKCNTATHSCTLSCGDGTCNSEECGKCPKDCAPGDCENGVCETNIGESCQNSDDCSCRTHIDAKPEEMAKEGDPIRVSFLIENQGNVKETYDIKLRSSINGEEKDRTIELSPGLNYEIDTSITSAPSGEYRVTLMVSPRSVKRPLTETTIVIVSSKSFIAHILEDSPLRVLLDLKDTIEIMLFLAMAMLFINRAVKRHRRPRYPQDSYFLYNYYPPQWYTREGYYQYQQQGGHGR